MQAVLACWLLVFTFRTGSLVVRAYNPLPVMDYWETVPHIERYLKFPPSVFWEQHYEHRVVFPELIIAFDWLFLKGRELLPLVLSGVFDIAVWAVLLLACRRSGGLSPIMRCALLLAGIVMMWPGVAFVLAYPFSIQFLLYQFSATAGLWALSRKRMYWAVALAIVASFSSANGLFVWPVLVFLGWGIRLGPVRMIALATAGAVTIAVFFQGYHNLGNTHPELLFTHTRDLLGYFFMYLGMPFGALGTAAGLTFGMLSLALFGFVGILAWGGKQMASPVFVVCFGICLLTLATASITAMSRLPLDRRPFEQAIVTPGRYVNFAAHYWAALSLLSIWTAARIRPKLAWAGVLGVTVFFAATLPWTDEWIRNWMSAYARYQSATKALESGDRSESVARVLNYADGSLVLRSLSELERRHLSLYSRKR